MGNVCESCGEQVTDLSGELPVIRRKTAKNSGYYYKYRRINTNHFFYDPLLVLCI